jgi:hypothetical protein
MRNDDQMISPSHYFYKAKTFEICHFPQPKFPSFMTITTALPDISTYSSQPPQLTDTVANGG